MSDDRKRRVFEVFDRVVALGMDERSAALDRECASDAELRSEVESLLEFDLRTNELPVAPFVDRAAEVAGPPEIDGYRILGEIGAGGMGVVYEAEQLEPRRSVAVKVLRDTAAADELRLRMFRREIEMLARLDHPGIATIHASGRARDGRRFFAMELVKGTPLDRFLAQAFQDGGAGRAMLRRNLRLFVRICEAIQYAHQRGVIHRDLKPSNILVPAPHESGTDLPEAKVLDFGLARLTDPDPDGSIMTEVGAVRGTLTYMSPEQADGDPRAIDLRTDVYSLGVILFQLLTSRLPYEIRKASLVESLRVITEQPAARPRDFVRDVDPDLETIALKALSKNPDDRYQSAHALGQDVSRYLESLPILARTPSSMYQLGKLVRRHRIPFAIGAAFAASLVGFAIWMSVLYSRAVEAEAASAREAETSRRVSEFLSDLFRAPDPGVTLGETVTARDLLDSGTGRIDAELADLPEVRASLTETMAVSYVGLGEYARAGELMRRALTTREELDGAGSEAVADLWMKLAVVGNLQGEYEAAEDAGRRALAIHETFGPEHPNTSSTLTYLSQALTGQGRFPEGREMAVRALEHLERNYGPEQPNIAWTRSAIGNIDLQLGDYEQAAKHFEKALAITEAAGHEPSLYSFLANLAVAYSGLGRSTDAEAAARRGLEIIERVAGPSHPGTARARGTLGLVFREGGRLAEADEELQRALAICRASLAPDHPRTAWTLRQLGLTYVEAGRYAEAEPLLDEALRIRSADADGNPVDHAHRRSALARLREGQGRRDEAAEMLREVTATFEQHLGAEHPSTREAKQRLEGVLRL